MAASAYRLITRICDRLRTCSNRLAEITTTSGVDDAAAGGISIDDTKHMVSQLRTKSGIIPVKLTLLPLSKALLKVLPKEGLPVQRLPFSVGRVPVDLESHTTTPIDLIIPDSRPFRISRQHFALCHQPDGCGVSDLGSTLGTELNGEFLGNNFNKDLEYLKIGRNKITAGGVDSPYVFRVIVEPE
jgi:hypothetical protein